MTSQHFSTHNGKQILWTDRAGALNAFYEGYHLLIERVIPTPEAITADRVVISFSPRRYRALVDGCLPDSENEFYDNLDAAKDAAFREYQRVLKLDCADATDAARGAWLLAHARYREVVELWRTLRCGLPVEYGTIADQC